MKKLKQYTAACSSVFLVACSTAGSNTPSQTEAQAATLVQASSNARAVINDSISKALNGTKVSVGLNAFVNSDKLTIQRSTKDPRGMSGLNGSLFVLPTVYHFTMVKQGVQCYVIDKRTNQRHLLHGVGCKVI